jgi:uncharacterized membrane protein YsdA (DUF1294 family)
MRDERPHRAFSKIMFITGFMAFTPAVAGALLLHTYLPALDWVQSWLAAVTVVTFLTYGYDKLIAGTGAIRVPERILLALAFTGGTVGALLGMRFFHHKTSKVSFLERFGLIVAVQAVAVAGWYIFLRPH